MPVDPQPVAVAIDPTAAAVVPHVPPAADPGGRGPLPDVREDQLVNGRRTIAVIRSEHLDQLPNNY